MGTRNDKRNALRAIIIILVSIIVGCGVYLQRKYDIITRPMTPPVQIVVKSLDMLM